MKKIIILLFICLLFTGCGSKKNIKECVEANNEVISNQTQEEVITEQEEVKCPTIDDLVPYTVDNMSGQYIGTIKCESENIEGKFILKLYNDGTFYYSEPEIESNIGNYLVKGNKVFLNYLMYLDEGKLTVYGRTTDTLTINDKNSITISNINWCNNSSINLKKDDTNFNDEGINEILKKDTN